jgi:hypothetical protein
MNEEVENIGIDISDSWDTAEIPEKKKRGRKPKSKEDPVGTVAEEIFKYQVQGAYSLRDPFSGVLYNPAYPVAGTHTAWIDSQIEEGLLIKV